MRNASVYFFLQMGSINKTRLDWALKLKIKIDSDEKFETRFRINIEQGWYIHICGPTQLNTHLEGVSYHGGKQDLVFQAFSRSWRGASAVLAPYRGIVRNACTRSWVLLL